MKTIQSSMTVAEAIENIRRNNYLLFYPLKCDFEWSADTVEYLFDSLVKGYPIGSMVFWKVRGDAKTSTQFHRFRDCNEQMDIHYAEPIDTFSVDDFYCVLDGIQRLAALYIGLCGSFVYYRKYYDSADTTERNCRPTRHLYFNLTQCETVPKSDDESEDELEDEVSHSRTDFRLWKDTETNCVGLYVDSNGNKWYRVGDILTSKVLNFCDEHHLNDTERENFFKLYSAICTTNSIYYYELEDTTFATAKDIFVHVHNERIRWA